MVFRFLDRYRPCPNGGAVVPSRPIMHGSSAREAALEAELASLYAEQIALGIERLPGFGAVSPPPAAAAQPHRVSAQEVIDAGARVRGEQSVDVHTGQPRSLVSPLTKLDPAAAAIVRAGRRARNEPTDDDR